jgi:multiple sugar transport system permease protein
MRNAKLNQLLIILILVVLSVITLLPFYVTALMSQKSSAEIINHFWELPQKLRLEFYQEAFIYIWRYIANTVIVGFVCIVLTVFLSSLAGYVFARINFGGKKLLFMLILGLMMIPGILTLIPAFLWMKEFPLICGNNWLGQGGHGFLNTRLVLILPYISGGQILGIFLCRTFFENLPESLFEAARLDGASEFRVYSRIALPLALPVLATLAIMNFVMVYNDYIWPLVTISNNEIQVFSVGVTQFMAEGNLEPGPVMAGYLIGSIPLVLVFAAGMKYYISGLTGGAVKG